MSQKTPIAIFTYNRPKHARQMLESLLKCCRLDECAVFIFCDGAKMSEHIANVLSTRQVVHEIASRFNDACVIEREQNMGLAHSIVNGVTELCTQYGRVIVLEDDLILHPAFLDFMLQSLDRYSEEVRVAQIAGFIFPITDTPDTFFLPLTTSWGWATWKRAWDLFSWDISPALTELSANSRLRTRFDLNDTYPYYEMLRSVESGKIDTWDIQWYWHTFHAGKLTLYPHRSLVWQNGFDGFATHTTAAWSGLQVSMDDFLQEQWHPPISFPDTAHADEITFDKLKYFLRRKSSRALPARLKELLKCVLTRLVK